MVQGINGNNGAGNVFNDGFKPVKNPIQPTETEKTSFVVPMTGSKNSVKREDLGNDSPYAGMGVDLSNAKQPDYVEIARQAAPEFANFTGEFKLNNTKEAAYDLADMNFKLQTGTPEGIKRYVNEHTNPAIIERNMSEGLSDLMDQFDILLS